MLGSDRLRFLAAAAALLGATALVSPSRAQKVPDIRIDTGGAPGTGHSHGVRIAASGDAVYAVWQDDRNGVPFFGPEDIYANASQDGGRTWLPADVRLDAADPPAAAHSTDPQIAASGSTVHVVWSDNRDATSQTQYDIYYNRSTDGGATWLPAEVRLDTGTTPGHSASSYPALAISGSTVYVAWMDNRTNSWAFDIYFNRSLDGGTTWLASDQPIPTAAPLGTADSWYPRFAVSGSSVFLVWYENRTSWGWDIFFQRSLDQAVTWLPADVRLNTGVAAGTASCTNPQIAVTGNQVSVVWRDTRSGFKDIYFNGSADGGTTWLGSDVRLDTATSPGAQESDDPRIAATSSGIFVTWYDSQNGTWDIFFQRSLDGGATWLPAETRLNTGSAPGSTYASAADVVARGSEVYVAWQDDRNGLVPFGGNDIYMNRSADAGTTWLAQDTRLDTGSPPGQAGSWAPRLAVSGNSVFAVWEDTRGGSIQDIYFNLALGFQPYGAGKAGTGGFVPSLAATGRPLFGATYTLDVAQGLGAAPGMLLLGASGPASIPLSGGTLLVQPPLVILPLALGGAPGAPGAGSASYPVAIPPNPLLVGLRFNFQVLLLDTGVAGNVSMSNGLESWIG